MQCVGEKLSASAQELGSRHIFDTRLGFSGTPSELLPRDLGSCEFEPGSEGKMVDVLTSPEFVSYTVKRNWTVRSLLDDIATAKDGDFLALIDTGALITGMTNLQVASYLLGRGLRNCEGVVYLDEEDRKMVLTRSSKEPVPFARCGLGPEKRFTFFDQVHTTGMDIKQAVQAEAVITVSKDMTLRDYAQGAWRMRGLSKGQRLHLYIGEEISQLIIDTVPGTGVDPKAMAAEVVAYLVVNACRAEGMQAAQLQAQNLASVWRQRALQVLTQRPHGGGAGGLGAGSDQLAQRAIRVFREELDFTVPAFAPPPRCQQASLRAAVQLHRDFLEAWQGQAQAEQQARPAADQALPAPLAECEELVRAAAGSGGQGAEPSSQEAELVLHDLDAEMESEREQEQEQEQEQEVEEEATVQTGRERSMERPWLIAELALAGTPGAGERGVFYALNSFELGRGAGEPRLQCSDAIMVSENVAASSFTGTLPRRLKNVSVVLTWSGPGQEARTGAVSIAEAAALRRAAHVLGWKPPKGPGAAPPPLPPMQLAFASTGAVIASVPALAAGAAAREHRHAHRQVLRFFNSETHFAWSEAVALAGAIERSPPADRRSFLRAATMARRRARLTTAGMAVEAVLVEPSAAKLAYMHEAAVLLQGLLGNDPRAAFEALDENGDGTLSQREMQAALRGVLRGMDPGRFHQLVKYADRELGDADGCISYYEFVDNVLHLEPKKPDVAGLFAATAGPTAAGADESKSDDPTQKPYGGSFVVYSTSEGSQSEEDEDEAMAGAAAAAVPPPPPPPRRPVL
eukprot:g8070.t1